MQENEDADIIDILLLKLAATVPRMKSLVRSSGEALRCEVPRTQSTASLAFDAMMKTELVRLQNLEQIFEKKIKKVSIIENLLEYIIGADGMQVLRKSKVILEEQGKLDVVPRFLPNEMRFITETIVRNMRKFYSMWGMLPTAGAVKKRAFTPGVGVRSRGVFLSEILSKNHQDSRARPT